MVLLPFQTAIDPVANWIDNRILVANQTVLNVHVVIWNGDRDISRHLK